MPIPSNYSIFSNKEKKCSTVSKSELELGNQNIKALYDTSKKSMSDFVAEYQRVSNNDYYGKTSCRLDYRHKLMDLYQYAMLDTHLTSIVDSLFHQIIGERYYFKNSDGTTNLEATKLIKKSWFVDYIKGILESK